LVSSKASLASKKSAVLYLKLLLLALLCSNSSDFLFVVCLFGAALALYTFVIEDALELFDAHLLEVKFLIINRGRVLDFTDFRRR